jgi:hypothetical protein
VNKKSDLLPRFFMNSVPKSGTHLLKNTLQGMPGITHDPKNEFYEGYPRQLKDHFFRLSQMKSNEFGAGHVYFSPEWLKMLKQLKIKKLFISRDPRDIVVSFTYFIVYKYPYHPLYEYLTKHVQSQKERYLTLIHGVNTGRLNYPSIADWYRPYQGWMTDGYSYCLTYEDLVRSKDSSRKALFGIANYLWKGLTPPIPVPDMVERMEQRMNPKHSLTFRSGKIGSWKDEFDDEVKAAFKKRAGYLLVELGYEKNQAW